MELNINLDNTYWEKLKGFFTENQIDSRYLLKDKESNQGYGSLRIVSHPDCPPGHLRSIFTYITNIEKKSPEEILQTIEDNQMDDVDLEMFSISNSIKTKTINIEDTKKNLENMYGVKILQN